ncbi:MAG: DUF86 domain-containing protein [Firmicutes bacterium]|nr:DUF86 domain-containing protein [Bacillota bacterium]
MDNTKDDRYYTIRIQEDLSFIIRNMEKTTIEQYSTNEILQDSMMFRLIQISENTRKLSDGFKRSHPLIPWTAVYGLRNRIVHDYGNIDLRIVFDTLKQDIPELYRQIQEELRNSF